MSHEHSIAVSVQLDFWDVYWGTLTVIVQQLRKFLTILGIVVIAVLALLLLASFQPAPEGEWDKVQSNLAPFVWFLGLALCLLLVIPLVSARKTLTDGSARVTEYRFSDSGVYLQGPFGNADLRWAAFPRATETQSSFLLFPRTNLAHTIPKRCFMNPDDIVAMRDLLRNHIAKSRLRRT